MSIEITVTVKSTDSEFGDTTITRTASYGDQVDPSGYGQRARDVSRQLGDEIGDCLDTLTASTC